LTTDAAYRHLLGEQCSIVVAENAMKWPAVHPAPDRYTFDEADTLVDFATQRGMQIRGHNLCWHEALPAWFAATVTTQNAAQVLTDHIRTVAGRYKGRLRAWDVVNEAVAPKDGRPDGLRDSPWLRLLGPGYIDLAFRTARAADPHALLTYNEYGIEYDSPDDAAKRAAVLRLLRTLKAGGTPIDAVGVQSHLSAASPNPLGPGILQFVTEAGTLGLKVFVTELDVNDDRVAVDDQKIRDEAVASVYLNYVTAMLTHPALTDVLTWGVSDNHSWLNHSEDHKEKHPGRQERALPFDAAYQPKLAFYGLRAALDSRMS
jgi:endo-1,4-beta-xylanase